jgi:hypothetical protein
MSSMLRLVFASALAGLLLFASPALAGTREQILRQCQDGRLTGDFTVKEIRDARNNIPTDIDQYTDCRDVLSRALAGKAGGGGGAAPGGTTGGGDGGTGGAGGSGTLTPESEQDRSAVAEAQQNGGDPVTVDGQSIDPGAVGLTTKAPRTALPTALIVVLALLGLAAALGAAPHVRRLGVIGTLGRRVLARGH